jgi:signal transduction histidine kinase
VSPDFLSQMQTEDLQALWGDLLSRPVPVNSLLQIILTAVQNIFGFNSSLIYIANYTARELVCCAQHGCEAVGEEKGPPRYSFDGHSLACKTFQKRCGVISEQPWLDDSIDQRGVRFFGVKTPVVGVPLRHDNHILGVLITWNKKTPSYFLEVAGRLELFASFAASHMAVSVALEKRVMAVRQLPRLLTRELQGISQKAVLEAIMKSLFGYPFDRVRLFEYHVETAAFIGVTSLGLAKPDRFEHVRISVTRNPYAQHLVTTYSQNPAPRLYMTADFGPDPDSDPLEINPALPWAVAPLVLDGELIGQIVVDNGKTYRAITDDALDYLHAISAIAVSAIASRRSIQFLSLNSLPLLYSSLIAASSPLDVVKKLLVYLTCGEALGFSRGIYLECKENPQRLVYQCSIGSLTEEQFRRIGASASARGLAEILRDAPNLYDYEIDEKLREFTIDLTQESGQELLTGERKTELRLLSMSNSSTTPPAWFDELAARIGEGPILTAPLHVEDRILGIFAVDRRWQPQPIREVDLHVLRTFSQVAAHILQQNEHQLENMRRRTDEQWENMAHIAAHQCKSPVADIGTWIANLDDALAASDYEAARRSINAIKVAKNQLATFTRDFLLLGQSSNLKLHPVPLTSLLHTLRKSLEDELGVKGVACEIDCPHDVVVSGDWDRLSICFREIISNSIFWADKERRWIHIEVYTPAASLIPLSLDGTNRYALIHVEDNGPGIDPEDEDHIFDPKFTRRRNEGGTGIGLYMVKRIVAAHKGMVMHYGQLGYGTSIAVFLPLFPALQEDDEAWPNGLNKLEVSACATVPIQS